MYEDLRGKSVLVTGGANGIGEAMLRAFAREGAVVHFCDCDEAAGRELASELEGRATFSHVNLSSPAEIQGWINTAADSGPIHVLLNNAARDPRIALDAMTIDDWDDLFALNLRAYFLTIQAAVKHMQDGQGSIVNFSSITCHLAPAEMSAYVATKMGIQGLTRSLARELGARGIRVNTLSPGWVMTDRQLKEHVTAEVKERLAQDQCIGELIQPEEIADVALFLASNASRAMTGQELLVDRGWAHS